MPFAAIFPTPQPELFLVKVTGLEESDLLLQIHFDLKSNYARHMK